LSRGEIAAVVNPAQLLQAIVVHFARLVVEGVAQKMHIAALPYGTRQHLADCPLETLVVVGNDKLDAKQATLLQSRQEIPPA
jgi:hypothetical protein